MAPVREMARATQLAARPLRTGARAATQVRRISRRKRDVSESCSQTKPPSPNHGRPQFVPRRLGTGVSIACAVAIGYCALLAVCSGDRAQQQQQQQQHWSFSQQTATRRASAAPQTGALVFHSPTHSEPTSLVQQASAASALQPARPQPLAEAPALEGRARNLYGSALFRANGRNSTGSQHQNSWHFPRISPEQAAEVLLTGAQVINRIAQADSSLNFCRTPDNQEGECSDIRKCIWLVLDKARLKQSVCLRNLIIPAVCCPLSNANNTPIANMIQSTLDPVLFRPKQPAKQKKFPLGAPQLRPLASIVNRTLVGAPPSSTVSLIIRNKNVTSFAADSRPGLAADGAPPVAHAGGSGPPPSSMAPDSSTSTSSTTTTTTSTTSTTTTSAPPEPAVGGELSPPALQVQPPGAYNRTLSQRYPWANETCGEGGRSRTGRIVGGNDSKLGQWPWMTAMYLNKRTTGPFASGAGEFWCGGALINRRFILTAAHCLSDQRGNRYKSDQVTIKLGGVDLVRHQAPADILRNGELAPEAPASARHNQRHRGQQARSESDSAEEEFSWTAFITKALGLTGLGSSLGLGTSGSNSGSSGATSGQQEQQQQQQHGSKLLTGSASQDKRQQLAAHAKKTYFREYKVASIKQHPLFQRHGFYNDIGLIELRQDVDYDDLISPICLPSEHDLKRDLSGYLATVLGWGTLSYGGQGSKLLQQVSMPIWNNKDCDERYLQHIGKTFICAGFLSGGKDACQGDSGGPLMVGDRFGRWTIHGVVSFGKTCAQAGYPGVYTRITEYLDWIRDNTDPAVYGPG